MLPTAVLGGWCRRGWGTELSGEAATLRREAGGDMDASGGGPSLCLAQDTQVQERSLGTSRGAQEKPQLEK